ncbi:hypothetical protein L198_08005 [Cryptococcus wingfieldii CBS 7118]|uniref:Major facilitator superfamily (MFS) profile domain-containing protein n=1 Tax=Cryptococcus wingfieldii CBS 7118 TaxID=1295528 RepID=A0A1E3HQU3_9TREE|nr:hypothetical protein L198_08005 [Cryptococcus wingfieldii CBS 7118]ODN78086.1 hypothetical protein L198_08005 [Cryptococcus wingfieldii CBS 7118]
MHIALSLFGLNGALASVTGFLTHKDKLKRLDIVGCFLMLSSIILLILGITLGDSRGWKTAGFLVPFLLCWAIFVRFFFWEAKCSDGYALIPSSFWKIPNMTLLIVFAIGIYPWWAVSQHPLMERFISFYGESSIIAAVRFLPQGISAIITAFAVPPLLQRLGSPRIPLAGGIYWKFFFTSFVIGSGFGMLSFIAANITVMTSVTPETSGVAGGRAYFKYLSRLALPWVSPSKPDSSPSNREVLQLGPTYRLLSGSSSDG